MATNGERTARASFCVVPQSALAVFRQRGAGEAVRAQARIDDNLLTALSEMVEAARAGQIEGDAALDLRAIAW